MPRKPSGSILKLEVRITPPDQKQIVDWKQSSFEKLLVCEEGVPNGTPKLHYHVYLETTMSKSSVRLWILEVLAPHKEPNVQYNGNQLYFTRQPHDFTIPYVLKYNNVLVRVGFTQSTLDEYFAISKQYVKDKERDRKRAQRKGVSDLQHIFEQVEKDLQVNLVAPSVPRLVENILAMCTQNKYKFPTKSQMDSLILRLMYPYDPYFVRSYYESSFTRY